MATTAPVGTGHRAATMIMVVRATAALTGPAMGARTGPATAGPIAPVMVAPTGRIGGVKDGSPKGGTESRLLRQARAA
jgi:hypothetical protein